jgi:hypothetical protein
MGLQIRALAAMHSDIHQELLEEQIVLGILCLGRSPAHRLLDR